MGEVEDPLPGLELVAHLSKQSVLNLYILGSLHTLRRKAIDHPENATMPTPP
ncbi:hypothetical protein [Thermostichus vulcanus]|uniref:Uncharacterized protein n=1 Tax=Thermostichus vulcanus str. 'Rupite' TaxID=2813851 RepID=A0ABT0CF17_THEVL|nr:hypothetical protein [Thermostichus vulcanus]MCJ2544384.1 hypothetical protein [Thermostichus vulcanus str. 'Rupite']